LFTHKLEVEILNNQDIEEPSPVLVEEEYSSNKASKKLY
jgi:hypothetical protein